MASLTAGIIGGTGPQGTGLALRLALAGVPVRIGSRQAQRAQEVAGELNLLLRAHGPGLAHDPAFPWITGDDNATVAGYADVLLLTVPYESADDTLKGLAGHFRKGSIFVDVTVPLDFSKGDAMPLVPPEGSGSKHLRTLVPAEIPFIGAGKTLPADTLARIEQPLDCHAFVFGDDKDAKAKVIELLGRIATLKPLDVGGLSAAATVEGMTALLIRINRRYKTHHARFKVTGLRG
jgi:hypothetical protein